MDLDALNTTAKALVAPGKGILAADESFGTIAKRFTSIGIESTEDNRRAYREMLFTTQGHEEFVSGVILFDETIRHTEMAERLSPRDPVHGMWAVNRATAEFCAGRYETVAALARKAV